MTEVIVTKRLKMFEAVTPEFYKKAEDCFVNCALVIERKKVNKKKPNDAHYEIQGLAADVENFLSKIICY